MDSKDILVHGVNLNANKFRVEIYVATSVVT